MDEKKNEIILFENQGVKLEVNLKDETVWLTQEQMSKLFEKAKSTINEHIKNIYKGNDFSFHSSITFLVVSIEKRRQCLHSRKHLFFKKESLSFSF